MGRLDRAASRRPRSGKVGVDDFHNCCRRHVCWVEVECPLGTVGLTRGSQAVQERGHLTNARKLPSHGEDPSVLGEAHLLTDVLAFSTCAVTAENPPLSCRGIDSCGQREYGVLEVGGPLAGPDQVGVTGM